MFHVVLLQQHFHSMKSEGSILTNIAILVLLKSLFEWKASKALKTFPCPSLIISEMYAVRKAPILSAPRTAISCNDVPQTNASSLIELSSQVCPAETVAGVYEVHPLTFLNPRSASKVLSAHKCLSYHLYSSGTPVGYHDVDAPKSSLRSNSHY